MVRRVPRFTDYRRAGELGSSGEKGSILASFLVFVVAVE